jgi:hypothetical protein
MEKAEVRLMRLILGHNQFLGISHISEKNAADRNVRFSDPQKILEAVQAASECGFRSMIIESHPRMREFMELYEQTKTFDMNFILQVPYVSGYIRQMAESGVGGIVKEIISGTPVYELFKTPFQLLPKLVQSDYVGMGVKALDLEMSKYSKYDIKGTLLHNVVTDLLMSLDSEAAFGEYFDRVNKRFGVKAGLITLNLPMLDAHLNQWGLSPGMIVSPINPLGFDMNPSKEAVEECVEHSKFDIIAMNILGGGSIDLATASSYLKGLKGLDGLVVGASTRQHMKELGETFGKDD